MEISCRFDLKEPVDDDLFGPNEIPADGDQSPKLVPKNESEAR